MGRMGEWLQYIFTAALSSFRNWHVPWYVGAWRLLWLLPASFMWALTLIVALIMWGNLERAVRWMRSYF